MGGLCRCVTMLAVHAFLKSLFIAEAISPEFEASIIVSFILLDALIHTDPPSKTQWRVLSKTSNNLEARNTIENRCLREDLIALLPVTCNSP